MAERPQRPRAEVLSRRNTFRAKFMEIEILLKKIQDGKSDDAVGEN